MTTMDVWIRKEFIPPDDLKNYPGDDACIKVVIDKTCKLCNKERSVYGGFVGSKNEETSLFNVCKHSRTYLDVYVHRIKTVGDIVVGSISVRLIDSRDDGMKCSGVCGQWVSMAQSNQKDNSFKCWSCRTRGW